MTLTVWTLKTCDTCRRALAWLDEVGIEHAVRDVREDGMDRETIARIVGAVGLDRAVNRRSTTWRGLPDAAKEDLDAETAVALIEAHPTLMKRPAFVPEDEEMPVMVGFDAGVRNALR